MKNYLYEAKVSFRIGRKPPVKAIIYAQGRSGSTLLVDTLASHPNIASFNEILSPKRMFPVHFLESKIRGRNVHAASFHVKCYQLSELYNVKDQNAWLWSMRRRGWRIIHLHRQDIIAQSISTKVAAKRKVWQLEVRDSVDKSQLEIDPQDFVSEVALRVQHGQTEKAALDGLPYFPLSYEADLLYEGAREEAMKKLQAWLDVPYHDLSTNLRKVIVGSPWDVIANAEEVQKAVREAGFGHLMDQFAAE